MAARPRRGWPGASTTRRQSTRLTRGADTRGAHPAESETSREIKSGSLPRPVPGNDVTSRGRQQDIAPEADWSAPFNWRRCRGQPTHAPPAPFIASTRGVAPTDDRALFDGATGRASCYLPPSAVSALPEKRSVYTGMVRTARGTAIRSGARSAHPPRSTRNDDWPAA